MLRLGGQKTWAFSATTCKNTPSGYPFSSASPLRTRLLVQLPLRSPNHIDGLSIYASQRFYSSLPPQATKSQATKIEPIFPTPLPRKLKVDLKPGPRPVNAVHHTTDGPYPSGTPEKATASSPQPLPTMQSASSPGSSTLSPSQISGQAPSKVKIAIADVVKAAEQGALAPPPAGASKIGKIWHQAKELFKFYIRGLKQLLVHRQIVRDIKARLREERSQGTDVKMTWEEAHFIKTYKEDLTKLVPFLLILLILEEALPLVVLYAPFLLPSTCILPNQKTRIVWKRGDAQYNARSDARQILLSAGSLQSVANAGVIGMPKELITSLVKVFGLSTRGPTALHRRRLENHLAYLVNDDRLLMSENMGSHLDLRNLKIALSERGFLTSTEESRLRSILERRMHALGQDEAQWKQRSLEFLFKELVESKDVKPTPVD